MVSLLWFRRDLRLADHPALAAAGDEVVPVFVLDPALLGPSGAPRRAFLLGCLRELSEATGGALRVLSGDPAQVVPAAARAAAAEEVHVSGDCGPYGRSRDERVEAALGDVPLVRTGSPYAVTPGRLHTAQGGSYRVYTPYARAWADHGVRAPARSPVPAWSDGGLRSEEVPAPPDLGPTVLPPAGERAALERWAAFREGGLEDYHRSRDAAAEEGTSRLSAYLKYGCVHPRTLLDGLGAEPGPAKLRAELVWRDFTADLLWHRPGSARDELQPGMAALAYDTGPLADERFRAWAAGRTGYPFVDAGMRQLLGEGWVHNRVRMVVASFLCKDLHLHWRRGARHFMAHLHDGDLAANQHGWQWVAGTGSDPSPYFRVFNPVRQGLEHDPHGDYVRRWVPELRAVPGAQVHQPWQLPGGPPAEYPAPIVDHAAERVEALRRYAEVRSSGSPAS